MDHRSLLSFGMNRFTPLLFAAYWISAAFAHPGALDGSGGQNDRKNGGYHYHRSPPATTSATASQKVPARAEVARLPAKTALTTATKAASAVREFPAPATTDLAKITLGMTKAQGEAAIGKPDISSTSTWHYTSQGWVRFRGETVFNIEVK